MVKKFFIAGTDTEVGKTYVSNCLLKTFNKVKKSTIGFKPIASGGYRKDGIVVNEDALQLIDNSSIKLPYQQVNPFSFIEEAAPHIASEKNNIVVNLEFMTKNITNSINQVSPDVAIIEGAGGWHTPINAKQSLSDFVKLMDLPVVLVVGIRLGCLNHSLLTVEAIKNSGIKLKGWVANIINPEIEYLQENIDTLKERIWEPMIGVVPYNEPEKANLNICALL